MVKRKSYSDRTLLYILGLLIFFFLAVVGLLFYRLGFIKPKVIPQAGPIQFPSPTAARVTPTKVPIPTKPAPAKLTTFCGINTVPEGVVIRETTYEIPENSAPSEWLKYEDSLFSIFYPSGSEVYSEDDGFNWCRNFLECQDARLFVFPYDESKEKSLCPASINSLAETERYPSSETTNQILWVNLRLGRYEGVGLESMRDEPNGGTIHTFSGIFTTNLQRFHFYFDMSTNPFAKAPDVDLEKQILGTFQPK